jgi:hypothetical protein
MDEVRSYLELPWIALEALFLMLAPFVALITGPYVVWLIVQRIHDRGLVRRGRRPLECRPLLEKFSRERVKRSWIAKIGKDGIVSSYLPEQGLLPTIGEDGKPSGYVRWQ